MLYRLTVYDLWVYQGYAIHICSNDIDVWDDTKIMRNCDDFCRLIITCNVLKK